ncbi:GNAT family N-acetyltransferase [Falsibacillus pallidus]|uniref:Putative GNAT family N-acyltransferase n=1 Tax=Falsibacillus pallidus TaxID=493781 RepID=A0A370H111_9BACI|nr:GNAT family N-acetyltransferase [Falsibacillus pallidus]RDI47733.1 putative GNAT family N-acyltransferase [Falsibacillus pallidus]
MKLQVVQNKQELEQAFLIRTKVFVEEQKVPEEEEIDQFENDSTHFLLMNDGDPIGAGRFRNLEGKGKVERICVLSSQRGTGAGKIIMSGIEEFAKTQGLKILKLNAQTQAIPFYEKLGYEVVSDEFLDAGIPHRTMEKAI